MSRVRRCLIGFSVEYCRPRVICITQPRDRDVTW
jgi:hypothetical protein